MLSGPPSARTGLSARLATLRHRARRAVLRRRRLLAALLTGLAVVAGLRAVAAPPPDTVPVLVAAQDLPAGTRLAPDDLRTVRLAPDAVPDGVAEEPAGRLLAGPVRDGEPLTDVRLVGEGLTDAHPGLTALPVRLPDAGMVALLEVGDRIDLVAAEPREGTAGEVAEEVLVLALPSPAEDPQAGAAQLPGRLVVVGVPPETVRDVVAASARALVTFTW